MGQSCCCGRVKEDWKELDNCRLPPAVFRQLQAVQEPEGPAPEEATVHEEDLPRAPHMVTSRDAVAGDQTEVQEPEGAAEEALGEEDDLPKPTQMVVSRNTTDETKAPDDTPATEQPHITAANSGRSQQEGLSGVGLGVAIFGAGGFRTATFCRSKPRNEVQPSPRPSFVEPFVHVYDGPDCSDID